MQDEGARVSLHPKLHKTSRRNRHVVYLSVTIFIYGLTFSKAAVKQLFAET